MSGATETVDEAIEFPMEELYGLSKRATTFLRQHPKEARMAVATALEVAALQYDEAQDGNAASDVPKSLQPFIIHQPLDAKLISVSEAAKRLNISRTTVYDWVAKKILLGWKSTKRGLMIPVEQILGPGKVTPGIAQVLEIIDDPELTWVFLSEQWPFADNTARPLDKLKVGDVEEVINAAPSFGTTFT